MIGTQMRCVVLLLLASTSAIFGANVNPDSPETRHKLHAAITGAAIADAASVGYQGVFDQIELQNRFKHTGQLGPEFNDPPVTALYGYKSGDPSHFGREYRFLLNAVVKSNGIDGSKLSSELSQFIKEEKLAERYISVVNTELLSNIDNGKEYPSAGSLNRLSTPLMKAPIAAALHAGLEDMEVKTNELLQVSQHSPSIPITYGTMAAEIIALVAMGKTRQAAVKFVMVDHQKDEHIRQLYADIAKKVAAAGVDNVVAFKESIETYGASGNLPTSFKVAVHCILGFSSFKVAIQSNILFGGDSPPRAMFIGAVFAAENPEAVSSFWRSKTPGFSAINEAAIALLNARQSTKVSERHTARHAEL